LRIDPNGRWTVKTALRVGQQLKNVELEYYEDPVRSMDDMAEVRKKTGLTMSTNSCVSRWSHVAEGVRKQPIDVLLGDHHWFGGVSSFPTLGTVCEALGWGLSMHSNNHAGVTMAAMIHAGAATPQLNYAADTHYVWLVPGADIIVGDNLAIEGGHMQVPKGPGLGVELDRDKLARAHETYRKCGMHGRDDAATMRRFAPGWKRTLF
jgi:glucarate dehydratase